MKRGRLKLIMNMLIWSVLFLSPADAAWQVEELNIDLEQHISISFALDAFNKPHYVYAKRSDETYDVYYQYGDSIEQIYSTLPSAMYISIAVDGNSNPHIGLSVSNTEGAVLKYFHKDKGVWDNQTIENGPGEGYSENRIAVDGNGNSAIVYVAIVIDCDILEFASSIKHARLHAGGWRVEDLINFDFICDGHNTLSLSFDGFNNLHMGFLLQGYISYSCPQPVQHYVQQIDPDNSSSIIGLYYCTGGDKRTCSVNAGLVAAEMYDVDLFTNIAVGTDNRPRLVYYASGSLNGIVGTDYGWEKVVSAAMDIDPLPRGYLALDRLHNLHIVFCRDAYSGSERQTELVYGRYDTEWRFEVIDDDIGYVMDVKMDRRGNPHILYNNKYDVFVYARMEQQCALEDIVGDEATLQAVRWLRDAVSANSAVGRNLVACYYAYEEAIGEFITENPKAMKVVQQVLEGFISHMSSN